MPRANSSVPRHKRHRKIVKQAKGYYGVRKSNFKAAKDAAFQLYADLSQKDQDFQMLFKDWQKFRNEVSSWNKVNEFSFSSFSYANL